MQRALITITVNLLGQPLKSTYFAYDNPIVAAGLTKLQSSFSCLIYTKIFLGILRVLGTARGLCNNIVRLDYSAPTSAGADV